MKAFTVNFIFGMQLHLHVSEGQESRSWSKCQGHTASHTCTQGCTAFDWKAILFSTFSVDISHYNCVAAVLIVTVCGHFDNKNATTYVGNLV